MLVYNGGRLGSLKPKSTEYLIQRNFIADYNYNLKGQGEEFPLIKVSFT